jgi:hypothetical protein
MNQHLLTQDALKGMGCGDPRCTNEHTVLYLHANCHERKGLDAAYDKDDGTLTLTCRECDREIAAFLIAPALQ